MKPYITSRLMEHPPGAPCPVSPDTPVWVLTVGNSGPFCTRAGKVDWENADNMLEDIVLAWAPVTARTAQSGLIAGNNRLCLCPATMTAAVQAWLDEELASPVDVVAVEHESGTGQFVVRVKRRDEGDSQ